MEKSIDYVGLVQKAQLGDKECIDRLAEAARERLYAYVYRHTLADDLTHDIVQESILKMLEALGELREASQFWPWLYKIALNMIRLHHRKEKHHRTAPASDMKNNQNHNKNQEVIADMVYHEFKETVFAAMRQLKPRHRSVINMRCYDDMQYSEIAKVIGCSEFAAQKLFYRAKKSLKKQLARHGFGKGSFLMALVLFGKLTAPSEAAAAQVTVMAAATKVGIAASLAAIATNKITIVSLTTAGALAVGTIAATSGPEKGIVTSGEKPTESSYVIPQVVQTDKGSQEYWYYYPSKSSSTVMMRVKGQGAKAKNSYYQYLQNAEGNFYFDSGRSTVHINNYRQWQKDLSVWRLPTDSVKLTEFLTKVEGKKNSTQHTWQNRGSLLAIVKQGKDANSNGFQITHHENVLGEDFFKYDWPGNIKVVDSRDAMHKRGWTYFTVKGIINGQRIRGTGRVPFVYSAYTEKKPWLRLQVADKQFADTSFIGLSRPWMGLHTIDTVRRDAAEKQIPFETKYNPAENKAEVILKQKDGEIIYTINMESDLVEEIRINGQRQGRLIFDYLTDIEGIGAEFSSPRGSYGKCNIFEILQVD
ncbi:MAG: RNA polymerase sigma factor [Planctomycetota bacterium]|jgi:RNA polymerase sigma-70 factor (ECF subfamily)